MIPSDSCETWNLLLAQAPFAGILAIYTIILARFQAKHDVFIYGMLAERLDKLELVLKEIRSVLVREMR